MLSLNLAIHITLLLLIRSTPYLPLRATEIIQAPGDSSKGCVGNHRGIFGFEPIEQPPLTVHEICLRPDSLLMTLNNGQLLDRLGRTGTIISTRQFTFATPPTPVEAIHVSGWSICPDGLLALGQQKEFFACGDTDFENIYDKEIADNCRPIFFAALPFVNCSSATSRGVA
ncbi:hypothetical protein HOY80DRAFT_917224 [Tuber brumale]|nr:hypothetical protein HOY80DRAFT_917224 [Tuber brumale]